MGSINNNAQRRSRVVRFFKDQFYSKNYHYESKLLKDLFYFIAIMRYLNTLVPNFIKYGISVLVVIYLFRGVVNGVTIPYSITYLVESARKGYSSQSFSNAMILLISSATIFAVTEIASMIYFKRLTRGIVLVKERLLDSVKSSRNDSSSDDLVGRIANDVDFVVWNINGVITTLLPNLFTAIMSMISVYSFNSLVGVFTAITLMPYIVYSEFYSRRAEIYRSIERRNYALSISYIKSLVYGERVNGDLRRVLLEWNSSIDKILWLDRYFWAISLSTALVSMSGIAFMSYKELERNRLDISSLAGLLSASLTAHFAMMNAMWALCIQGQTVAAIKRILEHLDTHVFAKQKYEASSS